MKKDGRTVMNEKQHRRLPIQASTCARLCVVVNNQTEKNHLLLAARLNSLLCSLRKIIAICSTIVKRLVQHLSVSLLIDPFIVEGANEQHFFSQQTVGDDFT
jgi:hypothetical protein